MSSTYIKTYKGDFEYFKNKLLKKEPFTISRFNDGEMSIIENKPFKASRHHGTREFVFTPNVQHIEFQQNLLKALKYDSTNYYTGIVCPCCATTAQHLNVKKLINRPEEKLTWANIFVNSNFNLYIKEIVPIFEFYDSIYIICSDKANIKKLPFYKNIKNVQYIPTMAWLDTTIVDKFKKNIKTAPRGTLFLIAGGPLANVLTMIGNEQNKHNTYIDIGSTLDKMLNLGVTRGYHKPNNKFNKRTCIWEV